MKDIESNFAKYLTLLRLSNQKTMEEMSKELGISKSTYCKLEHGTGSFSSDTLKQVASKLDIHPALLLVDNVEDLEIDIAKALSTMIGTGARLPDDTLKEVAQHFCRILELLRPTVRAWFQMEELK